MAGIRRPNPQSKQPQARRLNSLGLRADNAVALAKVLKRGLSFATLARFHKKSQLPLPDMLRVLHLPPRTLARRKAGGMLRPQESERLARLAHLYDQAVALFEGARPAAARWLQTRNRALGNHTPLELAETEVGARAVEDLIGRLEYGVYA
jgi:putative toxin-antitoxin system antitoxin component (TIGR02293 family)